MRMSYDLLSVRLSVTRRYCFQTVEPNDKPPTPWIVDWLPVFSHANNGVMVFTSFQKCCALGVCRLCLSVSLSVCSRTSRTTVQTSRNFLHELPVVRSSSGDCAIHYVLQVLWTTSCFHIMAQIHITYTYTWSLQRSELFTVSLNCASRGKICYRRLPCR